MLHIPILFASIVSAVSGSDNGGLNGGNGIAGVQEVDNRRAILIGVNGLRSDALRQIVDEFRTEKKYPNFLRLFDEGVVDYTIFAGGEEGTDTQQRTDDGPGWATILTGVWAKVHNISSDEFMSRGYLNKRIATVFNYLGRLFPEMDSVAAISWWPLVKFVKSGNQGKIPARVHARRSDSEMSYSQNDVLLTDEIMGEIRNKNPKFVFLFLGSLDKVGHMRNFGPISPKYMEALRVKASQIDRVAEEIERQRRTRSLDWLTVVTSAHGGTGTRHGTQKATDRNVFAVFHNPSDRRYSGGREIATYSGIDTITPTILDFFAPHKLKARSRAFRHLGSPIASSSVSATILSRKSSDSTRNAAGVVFSTNSLTSSSFVSSTRFVLCQHLASFLIGWIFYSVSATGTTAILISLISVIILS